MKNGHKNGKSRVKFKVLSRAELLAANERVTKRLAEMTPAEGFQTLVRAGIYTRDGKLKARYGGPPTRHPVSR